MNRTIGHAVKLNKHAGIVPIGLWILSVAWFIFFRQLADHANLHAATLARQAIRADLDQQSDWFTGRIEDLRDEARQRVADPDQMSLRSKSLPSPSPPSKTLPPTAAEVAVIVRTAAGGTDVAHPGEMSERERVGWRQIGAQPYLWETLSRSGTNEFWQLDGYRVCVVRLPPPAAGEDQAPPAALAVRWPAEQFILSPRSTDLTGREFWLYDSNDHLMAHSGGGDHRRPGYFAQDQLFRGASGVNAEGYPGPDPRGDASRDISADLSVQKKQKFGEPSVVGGWRQNESLRTGWIAERPREDFYATADLISRRGRLGMWLMSILSILVTVFYSRVLHRIKNNGRHDDERRMGRYLLCHELARGGTSQVFRAIDPRLERTVAIKIHRGDVRDPVATERFRKEILLTAQLNHPNTIAVLDQGSGTDGELYYVMDLIEGMSLQELIDEHGPQDPARVIDLLLQVCDSLSQSHAMGLIHRDIKPANILISGRRGTEDLVKVIDFGLIDEFDSADQPVRKRSRTHSISGTPMYMSPEAVREHALVDRRSDLYGVAAVGYALLTGGPLFDPQSSVEICLLQINQVPDRPAGRLGCPLPMDLQDALMVALAKDPDQRQANLDIFAADLRRCRDHGGWTAADRHGWWRDQR